MTSFNGIPLDKIILAMDASDQAFNNNTLPPSLTKIAEFGGGASGAPLTFLAKTGNDLYIIVRGSTEASDFLLGFQAIRAPFLIGQVHAGVLQAAQLIIQQSRSQIDECKGEIVVTGHSLGGSVSAAIAAMLRMGEKRTNVIAITAASFPIFDPPMKKATESFVTGFIYRDDPIPHLTLRNVQNLVRDLSGAAQGVPPEMQMATAAGNIIKWLSGVFHSRGVNDPTLLQSLEAAAPAIVGGILTAQPEEDLVSAGTVFRVGEIVDITIEPFVEGKTMGAKEVVETVGDHNQQKLIAALKKVASAK
jgi:hypothetical protein